MKRHFWKIEYSITLCIIFGIFLLMLPSKFIASKEASYISEWNNIFHKMEYVFNAMNAQADANITKGFKSAKTNTAREKYMMQLVKPYLRINEQNVLKSKYSPNYMNGKKVNPNSKYFFDTLYLTSNGRIVGIKDIKDHDIYHPAFMMMFDVNGLRGPNRWGKDIFGLNIFVDGNISPFGAGISVPELKKDCSQTGMGVYCSYYYRIGGDFNE